MKEHELASRGKVFMGQGKCHAAIIVERHRNGKRLSPVIELWSEDDEFWSLSETFAAEWLAALLALLTSVSQDRLVTTPVKR